MSRILITAVALAFVANVGFAQNAKTDGKQNRRSNSATPQATQHAGGMHETNLDANVAACALLANQEEVALAEFALQHTQNADVKKFAEMLVRDHRAAISKLERFAPYAANVQFRGRGNGANANARDTKEGKRNAGERQDEGSRFFAMERRAHEECLSMIENELSQKQGAEFDECYLGSQIGAHIGMLAKLTAADEFVSPELKQVIDEAMQTTRHHLDEAKKLAQSTRAQATRSAERDTGAARQ
jgi:predicted outer membrane protein